MTDPAPPKRWAHETPSIDEVRDWWDASPCASRRSRARVGSHDFFWDVRENRRRVEPHSATFADFARWEGKRVLEVGCGIGIDTEDFAHYAKHVVAVDLSPKSLEIARQRNLRNVTWLEGDAANLVGVVADSKSRDAVDGALVGFDLIYCWGALHHMPNPRAALIGMRSLVTNWGDLKPHGELRLMVYSARSTKAAAIRLGRAQPEAQAGCPIARTYTPGEIRDLLAATGWEATAIWKDHIFPYDVAAYVEGRYEKRPPWRWLPRPLMRACERLLGWHTLVIARPR